MIMKYQRIINLLDNTPDQPSKFRTKNWVEINDDSRGTYNTNSQIKFKSLMVKSNFCDYSDKYILVNGTITVAGAGADNPTRAADRNYTLCIDCITKTNDTQVGNVKDLYFVMSIHKLTEYSGNYSKTSRILDQFWRDKANNNITDSESFKSKSKF